MRCRGVTRRIMSFFLQYDPTLEKIYSLSPSQLHQIFKIPPQRVSLFYKDKNDQELKEKLRADYETYNILTIIDEQYPNVLKQVKDPPIVLYLLGNEHLLQKSPKLSIIGSRNPSTEAKQKTAHFVKPLVESQWTIVSGMAMGIDSYAHQLTLNESGKTIAILGSGFHHIYPRQNKGLYKEIMTHGLVISEYPPDVPPKRYHFPERNRIISGLSFGTLVIEAQERSGTLITVDQALDQGREVYAVPGSLFTSQTKGCHQMIQEGAKLVLEANDIIEDWEGIGFHLFYA